MMELALIAVGGLLGSSHCIGMCGALAVAVGAGSDRPVSNLIRQLAYTLGRVFTYASLGAIAGYGGWRLTHSLGAIEQTQAALALLAGTFLVVQGLISAGVIRLGSIATGKFCPAQGVFRPLLTGRRLSCAFLAGVLTGFLPCGLVYGYLALAAATGHWLVGMLAMAAFGAGTMPAMVAVGAGGSLLGLEARMRVFRVAAWCVVATGMIAILRGLGVEAAGPICPFCHG